MRAKRAAFQKHSFPIRTIPSVRESHPFGGRSLSQTILPVGNCTPPQRIVLLFLICCTLFVALYLFSFIYRYLLYAPPTKLSTVLRKKVGEAKKGSRRAARQKKTTALFRRTPRTPSASLCTRNDLDMQRGRRVAPPAKIFLFSALCRAARKAADVHPHFL